MTEVLLLNESSHPKTTTWIQPLVTVTANPGQGHTAFQYAVETVASIAGAKNDITRIEILNPGMWLEG